MHSKNIVNRKIKTNFINDLSCSSRILSFNMKRSAANDSIKSFHNMTQFSQNSNNKLDNRISIYSIHRNFHTCTYCFDKKVLSLNYKTQRRQEVFTKKSNAPIKYTDVHSYEIKRPLNARKMADELKVSAFDLLRFMPQSYLVSDLIPVREMARIAFKIGVKEVKLFDPISNQWIPMAGSKKEINNDNEETDEPKPTQDNTSTLKPPKKFVKTAPVVTIMGHTDHGKTTLLDKIRSTNIVDQEHGAITQHIGAFEYIEQKNKSFKGRKITFIDTPGHEAFSKMRSTGAKVTDVIVLVVAADDGVMPQTKESIRCAQKENVPIIVAINKIDKSNAYTREQIEAQLMECGIIPDTKGGDSPIIPISALNGVGIDEIMEAIYLQADMQDLKAPVDAPFEGVVIECKMHKALGMATTIIVKQGVLKPSTWLMAGTTYGKVKSIKDSQLQTLKEVGPGMAVEITGLENMPEVGSILTEISNPKIVKDLIEAEKEKTLAKFDEKEARKIFEQRKKESEEGVTRLDLLEEKSKDDSLNYSKAESDLNLYKEEQDELGNVKKYLPVIIRGDAEGSIDAFNHIISQFPSSMVQLRVVEKEVGDITERDIEYARATASEIICMNVTPQKRVLSFAETNNVKISSFKVIYHLIDYLKKIIISNLEPKKYLEEVGIIEVIQPFTYSTTINGEKVELHVAGGRCAMGEFVHKDDPNIFYHVKRGGKYIHEKCKVHSLKHFKDSVKSVKKGQECGVSLIDYIPKSGDHVICQELKTTYLTWEDLEKEESRRRRKMGMKDKI